MRFFRINKTVFGNNYVMVCDKIAEVQKNIEIYKNLEEINAFSKNKTIVFLCVGNSKIWYDSFGPIFGSLLKFLDLRYYIYGNMKSNITTKNLQSYVDMIYRFHINPYIIVIDSALSLEKEPIVKINKGPTICGVLNKDRLEVGDLSILYCLSKQNIKDTSNYYEMLKKVKKIARMLVYILNKNIKMY